MKTVIIAGPTATGKTDLAIKLSRDFQGIILNADSRQVYEGMNIGTNKGNIKENGDDIELSSEVAKGYELEESGVTGYLFNLITPDKQFDLAKFQSLALEIISKSSRLPFITGGTGLYLDSIIKGYALSAQGPNSILRQELADLSIEQLQIKLKELNNEQFMNLNESDAYNPRRLIRLIEKNLNPSPALNVNKVKLETLILYPKFNKDELYEKIDERVELMFEQGLLTEVSDLIEKDYEQSPALLGIGYKEVLAYLNGKLDLAMCKSLIKQGHRNYAKRQITWFEGSGRNYDLEIFDFKSQYEAIMKRVADFVKS